MRKTRAHKCMSRKPVLRRSDIAEAVRQILRPPRGTWRSMAGLAAAGCMALSTPSLAAFPPEFNLSDLDGSNGFVINGIDGRPEFVDNPSVSDAGDVNGDGIDDVIIGGPVASPNGNNAAGETYVVFGNTTGFPASFNLSGLDGSNGFVINGIDEEDSSGRSVSAAGDVNGDGIDDVLIGAAPADPNGNNAAGESYVVFGNTTGFPASFNLSDLDGSNGFVINGIDTDDESGRSVSDAGDVNGDGIDDVIIGAPRADANGNDAAGESYVVFGRKTGFPAHVNLSELDGSNGFVINGSNVRDLSGFDVSGAGDVDGDGIDDVIIGVPFADPNGLNDAGASYVVFGRTTGFPAHVNLSELDGSNGFVINGTNPSDLSGIAVSGARDVNADGIEDVIIGAVLDGLGDVGASYVLFGDPTGFPAFFNLSDLNGSNGFVINGFEQDAEAGRHVSGAGDVNGDGIDDVLIGAPGAEVNGLIAAGESYVVFGRTSSFPASINLSDLNGSNGFVINRSQSSLEIGSSVSAAGDVNGDGIDDIVIGEYLGGYDDPSNNRNYVVFGQRDSVAINIDIKPGNKRNVINPRAKGGVWVAALSDTDSGSPFDPSSQVDISTVEFGPDGAKVIRYKVKDKNKDGLGDLLLRFKIPETGIACGDTGATLTGETFEGQSFTGTDSVRTVGCKKINKASKKAKNPKKKKSKVK